MQERRNSIANALELHLSCINPSMYHILSFLFLFPEPQVIACYDDSQDSEPVFSVQKWFDIILYDMTETSNREIEW